MPSWVTEFSMNWAAIGWGSLIFVATFALSILAVGFVFVRLPATYFSDVHTSAFLSKSRPTVRVMAKIGKNVLGVFLVVLGIALSVPGIPGQGILTILLGVLLLDFPGKRKLECKLVNRPHVLGTINALRARCGQPPLIVGKCELDPSLPTHTGTPKSEQSYTHVLPRD